MQPERALLRRSHPYGTFSNRFGIVDQEMRSMRIRTYVRIPGCVGQALVGATLLLIFGVLYAIQQIGTAIHAILSH